MENLHQYQKVQQDLRKQILNGEFKEGMLLPSENTLSQKYNTTRATIRQALGELVKNGLINKQMGRGSVVISNRKTLGLLSFKGFSEVVQSASLQPTTTILEKPELTEWGPSFFYPLSAEEINAGCIRMTRLRKVNDEPVMLEYTFLPNEGLDELLHKKMINNSLFETLQTRHEIEVTQVLQDIRAVSSTAELSQLLKIKPDSPLLHIYRKYETSRPGFYIYSSLYCDTTNYTIGNLFN